MAKVRRPINAPASSKIPKELVAIAVIAVAAAAYYYGTQKDDAQSDAGEGADSAYVASVPAHGPADAPVVIAKWTDFQWPFCTKVGPTLKELETHYGEKLRVEYHHYPLGFHNYAEASAVASVAAHKQGKFWEYVDKLYSDTKKQDPATLLKYAEDLSLDMDKFKADIKDKATLKDVRMDMKAGEILGVSGTPSMFMNGKKLEGRTADEMKKQVDAELAEIDKLVAAGDSVVEARKKRILSAQNGVQYLDYAIAPRKEPPGTDLSPAKKPEKPKPKAVDKTVKNAVVNPGDPVKGPLDALVTIVECSEFQWPFCSKVGPTLKQIRETYKDDVRIIFKHRPLGFHKRATPAAIASMAANNQGKFWQYHDKLFQDTKKLEDSDLEQYARDLGLDMERFKADIAAPETAEIVKKHDAQCVAIGASGTPAFFVNGRYMSGALPFDQFKPVIDEELKKARKMVADGTPRNEVYNAILAAAKKQPGGALDSKVHKFDLSKAPADGPTTAVATLVVFSDFQWPFCARLGEPYHNAVKAMHGQLRVVFKQYPLSFHNNARNAAIASLAAHRQGKFWKYHDLLFQNMKRLSRKELVDWAKVAGLDVARFEKDMGDPQLQAQVSADMAEGVRAGVRGTPSIYLNGRKVKTTPSTVEDVIRLVNSEVLKSE